VRPNPSLHPKCYSGLRPLAHSGELKRWATAEYEAPDARRGAHRNHRAHRSSAPRKSLRPLRRSRSGGYVCGWCHAVRSKVVAGRPSFGGRRTTEPRNQCMLVTLNRLPTPLLPRGLSVQLPAVRPSVLSLRSTDGRQRRPAQPRIAADVLRLASPAYARG
jgi:hypothetical protein